ncbi:MAG: AAA family ATPase [Akkermansiaceae bacterium]
MIIKIIEIKNTGKFRNYCATGDTRFSRLNFIYGENGRGKTTLVSLLRSLSDGSSEHLQQRKTLGSTDAQTARILLSSGVSSFNGSSWSTTLASLEIFDPVFVATNVHSGEEVSHDHRKNLHKFAIGERGVELAREIERLDAEKRTTTREIGALKTLIQTHTGFSDPVETLEAIPVLESEESKQGVRDRMLAIEQDLTTQRATLEISARSIFAEVSFPDLNVSNICQLLTHTLDNIEATAEERVTAHISQMNHVAESWVGKGLTLSIDDNCPFCRQPLANSDIISAYRSYFNAEYRALKNSLLEATNTVFNIPTHPHEATIAMNCIQAEFWSLHITTTPLIVNIASWTSTLELAKTALHSALERKIASPIEPIELSNEEEHDIASYTALSEEFISYNESVKLSNIEITGLRSRLASNTTESLKQEKQELLKQLRRSEAATIELLEQYAEKKAHGEDLASNKIEAKAELDTETSSLLTRFQTSINSYLSQFSAGFEIDSTREMHRGGSPSVHYQIKINDNLVNASSSNNTTPSFKTCLSSGDKNTLAFAFFLARLDASDDLADKVLVFDDPMTSLDANRRAATQAQILRLAGLTTQLIVFSHDAYFLREAWDQSSGQSSTTLCLRRSGRSDSSLHEWNIESETAGEYYRNYYTLEDFLKGNTPNDPRNVARCIRPLLEANLRLRFPGQFRRDDWLGGFLGLVRDAPIGHPLEPLNGSLSELEQINEFSKHFHHDQNPDGYATHTTTDTELQGYVKRTISVLGGVYS